MMTLAGLILWCVVLLIHGAWPSHAAPVGCGPPPTVEGTFVLPESKSRYNPGDSITYECGFDYLDGNDTLTCMEDGTWKGQPPSCNWYCFEPQPVIYGKILFPDNAEDEIDFRAGNRAVYECDAGHVLPAPPVRHCLPSGEWDGDFSRYRKCVVPQCPDPGVPTHGRRIGNSFRIGDTVEYVCFNGYKMYGTKNRTCKANLRWDGAVPTCDPLDSDCPVPAVPAGGTIIGSRYQVGSKIEYHCGHGFVLLGDPIRTCMQDGDWSGEDVFCDAPAAYDEVQDVTTRLKPGLDRIALSSTSSRDTMLVHGPQPMTALSDILEHDAGVDFYFVFDTSGSISVSELHESVEFAVALVQKLGVNQEAEAGGTVFGALYFSRTPTIAFHAVEFKTEEKIISALREINETKGGTNIFAALTEVYKNMIPLTKKNLQKRSGSQTAILLFSDGVSNEGGDAVPVKQALERDWMAEIFTIMTKTTNDSSDTTKGSLSLLASKPTAEHFFSLRDVSEFRELIPMMLGDTVDYSKCGVAGRALDLHSERGKIVFGTVVQDGAWPWMVGVKIWDPKETPFAKLKCGGTLVDEQWIVTAAHCFDTILGNHPQKTLQNLAEEERFSVLLGSVLNPTHDLEDQERVRLPPGAVDIPVDGIYRPENYHRKTFYADIALLHLKYPPRLNVNIRPACLPQEEEDLYHKDNGQMQSGWVTGWGHSEPVDPKLQKSYLYEKRLHQVELAIQTNFTCKKTIDDLLAKDPNAALTYDNSSHFCAGISKPVNQTTNVPDACKGDSGGPFVVKTMNQETRAVRWKLAGIVSNGYGCAQKDTFGTYTRVDAFLSWIKSTMEAKT